LERKTLKPAPGSARVSVAGVFTDLISGAAFHTYDWKHDRRMPLPAPELMPGLEEQRQLLAFIRREQQEEEREKLHYVSEVRGPDSGRSLF
jgi:hypothetical protein